jgi:phosphoribosylformylglycinamidine synthase
MTNKIGCKVSLDKIPGDKLTDERILFSESHSRYLLVVDKKNIKKLENILKKNKVSFQSIGEFSGEKIQFVNDTKPIIDLRVDKAHKTWINSLGDLVLHA